MCMPRQRVDIVVTQLMEPTLRKSVLPQAKAVARHAALTRLGQFIRVAPSAYRLWAMHTHQAKVARLADRLGRERTLRRVLRALREILPSRQESGGGGESKSISKLGRADRRLAVPGARAEMEMPMMDPA